MYDTQKEQDYEYDIKIIFIARQFRCICHYFPYSLSLMCYCCQHCLITTTNEKLKKTSETCFVVKKTKNVHINPDLTVYTTGAFVNLHWLRVPERIAFEVAVQTYRALHGDAPRYLKQFTRTADIPSRHKLRSSVTDSLFVPAVRLSTVGRRAFPVAAV